MAPRASGTLRAFGAMVRVLREHSGRPEHASMLSEALLFDRSDRSSQELQPGGTAGEPGKRK